MKKRMLSIILVYAMIFCSLSCNSIYVKAVSEKVRMVKGETYRITAKADTNFYLTGDAIYNDGIGSNAGPAQYIQSGTTINWSMDSMVWTEITVISGELALQHDENLVVEKVDHDALNVFILGPDESIEIKANESIYYEPIHFNCYNSGISWEFFDSSGNRTSMRETERCSLSGRLTWSASSLGTLKITSIDGFSAISFSYYTGTRCSASKSPATEEEAWMIYHPFSVKEKDISIGIGEGCPLTITSNIQGYTPNIKFYTNGSSYFEGWEEICSNLSFKINIKDKIVTGISAGDGILGIKDSNTGYMENHNVSVTAAPVAASKQPSNVKSADNNKIQDNSSTSIDKVSKVSVKNKKKRQITVKWKKVSGVKGYQVQYALSKKGLSKGKRKNIKKTSITISKLKKKKTYYVRVRAYKLVDKRKVYGKWSVVKKIKTRR